MRRFAATTIASKRYLALARVTAESFRRQHAEIPFYTLLADEPDAEYDAAREPFETVRLDDLSVDDSLGFRFQYNELELSYASTPYLIDHLLDKGFDGVVFLKQETLVLGALEAEFELLRRHSVLLTPHLLEPPGGERAIETELNVLRAGVYNGGFIALNGSEEARRVLAWWKKKTRRNCFRAVEEGLHFEQRWLDFVPSLAPSCRILRDPGMNVGHWNLPERRVRVSGGAVTAAGVPCRVFRFSGYQFDAPHMVTRYNPHMTVESTGEAAGVVRMYQELLEKAGHRACQQRNYAYGCFDNGALISDEARRIYHDLDGEARRFGNPFEAGHAESYYQWLMERSSGRAEDRR